MVMDDPESVAQFHEGGVSNPGQQAVYDFSARALDALLPHGARLLDLGVGSGRALSALLRRRLDVTATAVDLAPNMLATARELFVAERQADRVQLVEGDITALPDELAAADWDGVSCVWTLHQLPDFDILRGALRQIAALRANCGAALWIFDFQRLRDPSALAALIQCMVPAMPPVLRKDALASEAAGFTLAELSAELAAVGLDGMSHGHARPLPYLQAHWLPADGARLNGHPSHAFDPRLSGIVRRDAALLRWGFTAKPFA
ncbi:methyltransferase [Mycobacteriaceae bacterium 1482268.1]|nr:methyltransferase [Mycobacteriaceae bacterium 1482268.1]